MHSGSRAQIECLPPAGNMTFEVTYGDNWHILHQTIFLSQQL